MGARRPSHLRTLGAVMKKLSAACACTAIISCLIPAIAFGQLGPGSEPAPRTYRDVDALGDQAFHSLARAVQLPCIDEDVRDGLIARVDAIIRQILEWSTAHVNDRHTATAELSKAGHWIDALTAEMSRLKLKQPCLEPLPRTSAGSNPPPPSGSGPAGPGACPPDESARATIAKRFDEGSKEEETLQAED